MSKTINVWIWIDFSVHRYWPWVGLISIIVLFAAVIVIKWGDKVIFFLFPFIFVKLSFQSWTGLSSTADSGRPLAGSTISSSATSEFIPSSFHFTFDHFPFPTSDHFLNFDYQGGDFELMEDGNGTMMDYQVLTVDDYLLLKQSAFSLTEENICWSCFFCYEIVYMKPKDHFFLSASYEGSYWICWIVMLWCIYTSSNKFLIIVIQLKLIEKHWIMFNNLLTIVSQLQEGGSLGGSVMEDYSPHGRDSRLTFFTRILYSVLFFIKRTFV